MLPIEGQELNLLYRHKGDGHELKSSPVVGVQDQKDMRRFMYLLAPRVYLAVKRVHQLLVGGSESKGEGWARKCNRRCFIPIAASWD